MYRQGDVMIVSCEDIPDDVTEVESGPELAHGEATGHRHRVADEDAADHFSRTGKRPDQGETDESFLVLENPSEVVHEEHDPIELDEGNYRVFIQREYSPEEIRRVKD